MTVAREENIKNENVTALVGWEDWLDGRQIISFLFFYVLFWKVKTNKSLFLFLISLGGGEDSFFTQQALSHRCKLHYCYYHRKCPSDLHSLVSFLDIYSYVTSKVSNPPISPVFQMQEARSIETAFFSRTVTWRNKLFSYVLIVCYPLIFMILAFPYLLWSGSLVMYALRVIKVMRPRWQQPTID